MVLMKNVRHYESLSTSTSSLNSFENNTKEYNERTVYLGDLDIDTTERQLTAYFDSINIATMKIVKQPHSSYAHVTFESAELARCFLEMAIMKLGNNKIVRVMPFNQPNNFEPDANLIIKNLELYLNESDIIKKFKRFGQILSCKLVRDERGESKCYAYLQFQDKASACEAIDALNNTYWDERCDPDYKYRKFQEKLLNLRRNQLVGKLSESDFEENELYTDYVNKMGKKIYVGVFKKRNEYSKIKSDKEGKLSNLYVKNFGINFGDRDLFNLFKAFGSIKSAKVRRLKVGLVEKPLGCGFVDFENPEEAEKARVALDGYTLTSGRKLSVTYADCKSRRLRKKLEESAAVNQLKEEVSIQVKETSVKFEPKEEEAEVEAEKNQEFSHLLEYDYEEEIRNRKLSLSSDSCASNYSSSMMNDVISDAWSTRWSNLLNTSNWSEYKLFDDGFRLF
jgi:polyadenylate-binding protein